MSEQKPDIRIEDLPPQATPAELASEVSGGATLVGGVIQPQVLQPPVGTLSTSHQCLVATPTGMTMMQDF